ncbi:MAG: MG2 domain-containing protein, partial [Elusimicrobiales bacterium]
MKIFLLLMSLAAVAYAGEDELKKADALFERALYQEALGLYSARTAVPGETGLKAQFRAAECEGLLFRYGEAVRRFSAVKLPGDPLWRGRFLLLRAELGRQFLSQYGYSLPADLQQGASDVTKLTAGEWRRRIEEDYDALWAIRGALADAPIGGEIYFLDLRNTARETIPSLWDFAVLRWSGYLLGESVEEEKNLPQGLKFITESYKSDYNRSGPAAEKAAALYEDAAGRAGKGRQAAAEQWKIKRLLIPFAHGDKVSVQDPAALRTAAVAALDKWSRSLTAASPRASAAYEAAVLSDAGRDYAAAIRLCKTAEALAPGSRSAALCEQLRARIELPQLRLAARFAPPPGRGILSVNVRNLPKLYFRAYRTDPDELAALRGTPGNGWERLRSLQDETVDRFLQRPAALSWETEMRYPGPYQYADRDLTGPELKKGLYVIIASGDPSFNSGASLLRAVTVNITEVLLFGTSGVAGDPEDFLYDPAKPSRRTAAGVLNFYAVNALTGLPVGDALIDAFYSRDWGKWSSRTLRTGADGSAVFSDLLSVSYPSRENLAIDPLLTSGGGYAYWSGSQMTGLSVPEPVSLYLETDRPVYRPGQEVKYKITALVREPRGFRTYDGKNALKVTVRDRNWQELFSKQLPFTGLGGASGGFTVPAGRLLGQYSITAELRAYGRTFSGTVPIEVEEYKRPEFEVRLGAAESAFKYGRAAKVEGSVKYYFGSPVPGAKVSYRIKRSRYFPWYAWRWGWLYGASEPVETASGECAADEKGAFSFTFIPMPETAAQTGCPSSFQVEVSARDAGGRTIEDSRSYTAGAKAYLFDISPEAGFYTSGKPAVFRARLMDLNDAQASGKGSYSVFSIDHAPEFTPSDTQWGSFGHTPSLEQAFSQAPDGGLVQSGSIEFSKKTPATVKLKALKEGVYRLRLKAADPWGGETEGWVIIVCSDPSVEKSSLVLPPVALFEHASYQAGETARVLIGASALKGVKFLEVLAGNFILSRKTIPAGGVSLAEIKVGPEHRGGFGLRWFGAGGFKIYSAMAEADVPRREKELSLSLDYDKVVKPGQRTAWALKALDAAGRPVNGEAVVRIFDRSLEYYRTDSGFWTD